MSAARAVPATQLPLPAALPSSATALLVQARGGLAEAAIRTDPRERYAAAHLAALRAAAAVLAARTRPAAGRGRPRSAWVLLTEVAPELGEWATFFAAGATKRAAAEAGLSSAVTEREADDLVRDVAVFLRAVEKALEADPWERPEAAGPARSPFLRVRGAAVGGRPGPRR